MKSKINNFIRKKNQKKIICLTAYSKNIAKILDKYCDIVLVGDSMANVLYGSNNTHKITLKNIIQHTGDAIDILNNLNSSPEMLDDNIFPIPKPAKEI